jgi:carboxypeptidase Q
MLTRRTFVMSLIVACVVAPAAAQLASTEKVDLDAIYRIKDEGLQRSQVMNLTAYLTDVYGPRLTNSPEIREAGDWAMTTLRGWGVTNVREETWHFGRGWHNERMVAAAATPRAWPLIAYPKPWTPGTNGPVTAEAVLAPITSEKDFDDWRGKLNGRIVLTTALRDVPAHFDPPAHRYTASELDMLAEQPSARRPNPAAAGQQEFARKRMQFFKDEGVVALLDASSRGDGGTVFVQAPPGVSRDPKQPLQLPQVTLAIEHYGRIARTLEKKIPVTLQLDVQNRFFDDNEDAFNIVGEIRGTDKADEVVMLGAHFDSWASGTGATDNAAGSAVMMEAMRILEASGVRLRRTVRIGLWSGEEEGLLGSKEYVKAHLGDPATMKLTPDHAKFAGYFDVDNGTGQIRGVYLQGNEAVAPIFRAWMEPFHNMGMGTLTIRNTSGTDHLSFDAVGLPGFQFVQDPIEYDTRTHHSNMDVYERIQPQDMMRNAVIVATFVYEAANRDEKLPRKPLPKPQPPAPRSTSSQ